MSITPRDQVSRMYGRMVADDLFDHGLLAGEPSSEGEPEMWMVRVKKLGRNQQWNHSAPRELRAMRVDETVDLMYDKKMTAKRTATMAKNMFPCMVHIIPLVLTPLAAEEV